MFSVQSSKLGEIVSELHIVENFVAKVEIVGN